MSEQVQSMLDQIRTTQDDMRRVRGDGYTLVTFGLDNVTLAKVRDEFPDLKVVTSPHVPDSATAYLIDQRKLDEIVNRPIRFTLEAK